MTPRRLALRLVREHMLGHWRRLGISALFMALAALAVAGQAKLIEPAVNDVFVNHRADLLPWIAGLAVGLAVLKGVATSLQSVFMESVGQRVVSEVQMRMFRHMLDLELGWFHDNHSGRLVSAFLYDASLLREAASKAMTGMVKDSLTAALLIGLMYYQDWRLAIVATIVLPLAIQPVRRLSKRLRKASVKAQELTGDLSALLDEVFSGIRHVKAYRMERAETERAQIVIDRRLKVIFRAMYARAWTSPLMEMLGGLAIAGVIYYGGSRVIAGDSTSGAFFSFIAAMTLAYQPLKALGNLNSTLQDGLAAASRVFALIDRPARIVDAPGATVLKVSRGEIDFGAVDFDYGPQKPALRGVSLVAAGGRKTALVGPSGAGKSTLLNLIPRFYQPDGGRILIDGQDIAGVTLESLRGAIALVSQEATLFDDTIRANIAYGRPGASEAEITGAARAAAADGFIQALPQGYETRVGEAGVKLSGGQRQRIAIARAMLKDAPILLLDEATSALDSESERQIQEALDRLCAGRTTLVVAHRLSTIADADLIHVIERGTITTSGRHADLLARGGTYADLWSLQARQRGDGRD